VQKNSGAIAESENRPRCGERCMCEHDDDHADSPSLGTKAVTFLPFLMS
jgi:hypothetical protein